MFLAWPSLLASPFVNERVPCCQIPTEVESLIILSSMPQMILSLVHGGKEAGELWQSMVCSLTG
jgi:hypothetical protein